MIFKFCLRDFFYIDYVFLRKKKKKTRRFNIKNDFESSEIEILI